MERYPNAISLVKIMERKGIRSNLVILSILMNCYSHMERLGFGLSVFANTLKRGYHPDPIMFTILIRGFCQKGLIDDAFLLNNKVTEEGFILDEVTEGTLIKGLCSVGQPKSALQLFVNNKVWSNVSYTTMIDYLFKFNSSKKAEELYHEMIQKKVECNVITYTVVVKGFCSMGSLEKACATCHEMQLNGVRPNLNTYTVLMDGFCSKGRVRDATTVFGMIIRAYLKPGVNILNSLMHVYDMVNHMENSKRVWNSMTLTGLNHDTWSYNIMLNVLGKDNRT